MTDKTLNYIVINSQDKDNKIDTSTNFVYSFSHPIKIKNYIKLVHMSIPETSYLIQTNKNDKFHIIFADNTNKTITIPQQNYDETTLANIIKTLVNYANFDITVNYDLRKFVLTANMNFTIKNDVNYNINDILGLNILQDNISIANTLTCPNIYDFLQPSMLYISIDELKNNKIMTKKNLYTSFVVPVFCGKNDVNFFDANHLYENIIYVDYDITLNYMNIKIYDQDGNLYNNQNSECQLIFIYN